MKELPTEHARTYTTVKRMVDGQLCIRFEGDMFRSLPGELFGLLLKPETTQEEAEALAAELRKHCSHLFVAHQHAGLSETELDALTEMYDDLGLLDPDPCIDALEGTPSTAGSR